MPAVITDNLIWLIGALVIGVALLALIRRASSGGGDDTIAPPATAPEPVAAELATAPAAPPSFPTAEAAPPTGMTAIGVPAAIGPPDDLSLLKGVGPKLVQLLTDLEITRYDQIAAWTAADMAAVDAQLGTFKGRIARDHWIEQAGLLARGDYAGFEAKFGKLDRLPQ